MASGLVRDKTMMWICGLLLLVFVLPCRGQELTGLGVNPHSGRKEVAIQLAGLPEEATPLVMVSIPAGTFIMGSSSSEQGHFEREGPRHKVTISKPFYIGKYEITQAQWKSVMGSNPARDYGEGNNVPVYNVSWNDCQSFIQRLNGRGFGTFRLPTEAEWEYACRAGTETAYYWGEDPDDLQIAQYAWYREINRPMTIQPIGRKKPNAWGLYDMAGNVYEWCYDLYGIYPAKPQIDPIGPASGEERVLRGGTAVSFAWRCRSAFRNRDKPENSYYYVGFRVAGAIHSAT